MELEEDLETNPWLQALKKRCPDLFKRAAAEGLIICVPTRETIDGLAGLTREVFEAHILRSSPFFAGVYEGLSGQTVDLEDRVLETRDGFSEKRKVRILFEELHYNADFKQFRVLCVSQPLCGSVAKALDKGRHRDVFSRPRSSLAECNQVLDALALKDTAPLYQAAGALRELLQCYVVARGFLEHARGKVNGVLDGAVERLITANPVQLSACSADGRRYQALREVVETVVMDMGLHTLLLSALSAAHQDEDARIGCAMLKLADALPEEVGADPAIACDLSSAIAILQELEAQATPLDKVDVLRRVARAISDAVEAGRSDGTVPSSLALSADDLLPLHIWVVARARPEKVYSNACLVQHFAADLSSAGSEAGFHAANFRASADYLLRLAPRTRGIRPAMLAPPGRRDATDTLPLPGLDSPPSRGGPGQSRSGAVPSRSGPPGRGGAPTPPAPPSHRPGLGGAGGEAAGRGGEVREGEGAGGGARGHENGGVPPRHERTRAGENGTRAGENGGLDAGHAGTNGGHDGLRERDVGGGVGGIGHVARPAWGAGRSGNVGVRVGGKGGDEDGEIGDFLRALQSDESSSMCGRGLEGLNL